jgi:hypothetical protein
MSCLLCDSEKQAEFTAEINIHYSGLENIDNPGVLFLPKLLLCLDCGFSTFTTPKTELMLLARGIPPSPAINQLAFCEQENYQ